MPRKLIVFIILLTLFSFLIRIYRITEPNRYYFDEVYHAVTAKAYAQNNRAAYNPFSPPPQEGTAYDWLHPPLAKLIQAGSIKVLSDRSLAWRLPSAVFGTGIIVATFALAYILFGPLVAVFSSTIIAFENLNLVMSRITMNDVFITFFALCAFIFSWLYLRKSQTKYLLLTSVFLGLAWASKWTGLYAIAAVFSYILIYQIRGLVSRKLEIKHRKLDFKILILLIIPPIIYVVSYFQYFIQGYTVQDFIGLHKQIWWYQNRHDLEHSYGTTPLFCVPKGTNVEKSWCPWVLDIRGVYFSYEQYGSEKAGYIYALGNPIIFWLGFIAISYMLGKFIQTRSSKILYILVGYFIFWMPWIFTPRLLFLYHYLPAIPFLAIAAGYALTDIYKTRFKIAAIILLLVMIAAFFYFYPISSGWPIKTESINHFMWLSTWR